MFKAQIRLKTITSTTEENTYLASFTPSKGDSYILITDGTAVQKTYSGTEWVSATAKNDIESVRLQVTESTSGNLVIKSLGVSPINYQNQQNSSKAKARALKVSTAAVEESPVDYAGNEILMFNNGICIGDESTKGTTKYNYPLVLTKRGVSVDNAGIAGVTAGQWKEQAQINYNNYDFAIIMLGAHEDDVNIFASNMGSILGSIGNKAIFLCTLFNGSDSINEVIRALVPAMKDSMNIHLIDLAEYSSNIDLTALGYTQMANEIYAMISYTINQNLDDFKNAPFTGTNYSI